MHSHFCKHCDKQFICGEDAAECFRRYICCDDCFWSVKVKWFALVFVLGIVALAMTLFVADSFR